MMKRGILSLLSLSPLVAFADDTVGGSHPNPLIQFLPLVVIVVLLYFVMIRPQMKQNKEHRNLLINLQAGDEVQTQAGIIGKIVKLNDQYIDLAIADNVEIKILKKAISGVVPKGTLKSI